MQLTAIVRQEGQAFTSFCPELDVASVGKSIEDATANLKEAVRLFLEVAPKEEIQDRYKENSYISTIEVTFG